LQQNQSKADVQDRPDRQHRELDALQQAQRAGQFMQQQLCGKCSRQNQRYGVQAERVEGYGERSRHAQASERQF
jgi:hypothetical protein